MRCFDRGFDQVRCLHRLRCFHRTRCRARLSLAALSALAALAASAARAEDYVPKPGEFPPPGVGHYFAGELVSVDHVNRRGALRLVGDGVDDRYHGAPSHRFALLPYGTLRYHGAPAELRDLPIGTVLHGYFVLPPAGDASVPPPEKHHEKYVPPYSHAISLEDDFSFHQRRGQAWKVLAIDVAAGALKVAGAGPAVVDPIAFHPTAAQPTADGDATPGGAASEGALARRSATMTGEQTFTIDASTRVWRGRGFGELADIRPGQIAQLNLTWAPDWKNGQFHVADIWLDEESRTLAAERQRRIHVRHQRHRWLAGWVEHVEHQPGGKGVVTVALFGGMDPSLYDAVRAQAKSGGGASIAAAEWTLRTWWQDHDSKNGPIVECVDLPDPPTGSAGVRARVRLNELLEGYRPGRVVRLRPNGFPNVKLPPEERVKSLSDR